MHWDDFRIANQLAISGTFTAAGEALGINHATVIRHINRLEKALNTKLFIRHQRGCQLTEAGRLMQQAIPNIQSQFNQLADNISLTENALAGVLTISTTENFSLLLNPILKKFQAQYPEVRIRIIATDKRVSLQTGEVHASVRVTTAIEEPDLIAHKIKRFSMQLWATKSYIDQYGIPQDEREYAKHKWVLPMGEKSNLPFFKHLIQNIPPEQLVYQSNSFRDIHLAVYEGIGIGPISDPHRSLMGGLVPLPIKLKQTDEAYWWFVYHINIKHNQRVKVFFDFLKAHL